MRHLEIRQIVENVFSLNFLFKKKINLWMIYYDDESNSVSDCLFSVLSVRLDGNRSSCVRNEIGRKRGEKPLRRFNSLLRKLTLISFIHESGKLNVNDDFNPSYSSFRGSSKYVFCPKTLLRIVLILEYSLPASS